MKKADLPKESSAPGLSPSTTTPLVFISHDSRDAALAEAFSKLLKSVSAGMIKTFRSTRRAPRELTLETSGTSV
jgi:hypothetical protein